MVNDLALNNIWSNNNFITLDKILQRPYEWTDKRAITLISDILSHTVTNGIRYNIGDVITYNVHAGTPQILLYDGQQRLTTIHLLIYSIYNSFHSLEYRNRYYGYIYQMGTGVRRFILRDTDNNLLEKILNGAEFTKEEKQTHIVKNYLAITEKFVKGKDDNELFGLLNTILYDTSYYERVCTTQDEGVKQFLNLNAKGQVLSESRKALGFLYDKMQKRDEDFLLTLTNMSDDNSKCFYALYCYYKGLEYREKNFQDYFDKLENINIIDDCRRFYNNIYCNGIIHNPDPFFKNVSMVTSLSQIYIDLFTDKYSWTKELSIEQKKEIFKLFEWGYVSRVIEYSSSSDRKIFNSILTSEIRLNFDELRSYVIKLLKTQKRAFVSVERLEKYDAQGNQKLLKLLLSRIEYILSQNSREKITHNDTVTIEHIYPQKFKDELNNDLDYSIVHTIGNCTLMGQRQNSSNSTKRYEDKLPSYENSPYKLNQILAKQYMQWNKETIKERTKWCIEQLIQFYGDWIK